MVIVKFVLFGMTTALFQCVNLWIAYSAYATMHFCSVLVYMIICAFDLFFVSMDVIHLMESGSLKIA